MKIVKKIKWKAVKYRCLLHGNQAMALNIQYVTIYKFSVPYFYNMYFMFFLNIGLIK